MARRAYIMRVATLIAAANFRTSCPSSGYRTISLPTPFARRAR